MANPTLAAAIGPGVDVLTVSAANPSPTPFLVQIDSEILYVRGGWAGTNWDVDRGLYGTGKSSHANGATIYPVFPLVQTAAIASPPSAAPTGVTDHALLSNVTATQHHSNANDPSAGQAAALAGTSGTPGSGNKFVTDADSRNTNSRTPSAHATTHQPAGSDAMAVDASAATGSLRTLGTGAAQAAAGNDSRLSDSRTPTAHATTHKSGGSDAIKLDELAAPTDVTTLDASTSAHGLLKKLPGGTTTFLRGDGTFAAPASGGLTHSYVGYNTAGASTENVGGLRQYMKKITLAAATYLSAIGIYCKLNTDSGEAWIVGVLADVSGVPGGVLAMNASAISGSILNESDGSHSNAPDWLHFPIGIYLAAGDYWLAAKEGANNAFWTMYYDGSGSDVTIDSGTYFADGRRFANTVTTKKYSIRADVLS